MYLNVFFIGILFLGGWMNACAQQNKALEVLLKTKSKLEDQKNWNPHATYGETCHSTDTIYSLGCAISTSQQELRGKKASRNKEMRVLRRKVFWRYPFRAGLHPITYFNAHKKTTHKEVIGRIKKAIKALQ